MKIKDIREVGRRSKTELKMFIHYLMDNGYDDILGDNVERVIKRAYPQYGNDILDHYEINIDQIELFFKVDASEVYAHFVGTLYLGVEVDTHPDTQILTYPVNFKLKVFNTYKSNILEEVYLEIYTM